MNARQVFNYGQQSHFMVFLQGKPYLIVDLNTGIYYMSITPLKISKISKAFEKAKHSSTI